MNCANCEMPIGDEGAYHSEWYGGDVCHKCYFLDQSKRDPKIFALIGQRCSGKSILSRRLAQILPALHVAKRHTTREKRDEKELDDHIFVNEKEFDNLEFIYSFDYFKGYKVGFHEKEIIRQVDWFKKDVIISFTDTGSFLDINKKIKMIPVFILVDEKDLKLRLKDRSGESSLTESEFIEETERFLDIICKMVKEDPETWVIQNKTGQLKLAIKQLIWIIKQYRSGVFGRGEKSKEK